MSINVYLFIFILMRGSAGMNGRNRQRLGNCAVLEYICLYVYECVYVFLYLIGSLLCALTWKYIFNVRGDRGWEKAKQGQTDVIIWMSLGYCQLSWVCDWVSCCVCVCECVCVSLYPQGDVGEYVCQPITGRYQLPGGMRREVAWGNGMM